jgi:hypothetical protein
MAAQPDHMAGTRAANTVPDDDRILLDDPDDPDATDATDATAEDRAAMTDRAAPDDLAAGPHVTPPAGPDATAMNEPDATPADEPDVTPADDRLLVGEPVVADEPVVVVEGAVVAEPLAPDQPDPTLAGDTALAGDTPDTIPAAALAEQQWPAIQSLFVDDPRGAVERAAAAAGEVAASLVATLEREQAELRASWQDDADTEGLRTALQRYRAFCGRVEGLA